MTNRVLVTGATGFVGQCLCPMLRHAGWQVRGTWAHAEPKTGGGVEWIRVGPLGPTTDWNAALEGVDHVVHLAAVAHRTGSRTELPDAAYEDANHLGTAQLAQQVKFGGSIRRLVFVSSIGAVTSTADQLVNETTLCRPDTPYGRSKLAGEGAVRRILDGSGVDWCIFRPPLVYGPGNPGNMARLLGLLALPVPLPLGSVRNCRTFIYVANLADAIGVALTHRGARNQVFCLGDDEDLSTPELLQRLGRAAGRRVRLWPCPRAGLEAIGMAGALAARILGRPVGIDRTAIAKLVGSLRVDSRRFRNACGWRPPVSTDDGLRMTVAAPQHLPPRAA